jgi:hypothetical protein
MTMLDSDTIRHPAPACWRVEIEQGLFPRFPLRFLPAGVLSASVRLHLELLPATRALREDDMIPTQRFTVW